MKGRTRAEHKAHAMKMFGAAGYKGGGDVKADKALVAKAVGQHEAHDHKGEARTHLKLKSGGHVDGKKGGGRADRKPRSKGGNHTTVVIAGKDGPDAGGAPPMAVPHPVPVPVPVRPPMLGGPPPGGGGMGGPPMPPPMPMKPPMMGPPPGGPPMKRGGAAHRKHGGEMKKNDHDADDMHRGGKPKHKMFGGPMGQLGPAAPNGVMPGAAPVPTASPAMPGLGMKHGGAHHRAKGGKVELEAGAASGEGRLEKTAAAKRQARG